MNEDEEQEKQEKEEQKKELAKEVAKTAGKEALKKAGASTVGKAILAKVAAIIAAALPVILTIVITCIIAGLLFAAFQWVIDVLTSKQMGEITTDLTSGYCTIDDAGIHLNKDAAIKTIEEVLAEHQINTTGLGLGTNQTEAYEYLYDMLAASIAAELPNISGSDPEAQGIVTIMRKEEEGVDPVKLEYIGYNSFKDIIQNGDRTQKEALKLFYSIDDKWNLCIVKTQQVMVNGVETQFDVYEIKIPYRTMVSQYGMPFNFLINLLQVTQNGNYVKAVTELMRDNSEIELTIFDSITTTKTTETYKHSIMRKWVVEVQETVWDPNALIDVPTGNVRKENRREGPIEQPDEVTETIVKEDLVKANVTKANTWMVDQVTNYVCQTTTEYPYGVDGQTGTIPDEPEPPGDEGTWKVNQSLNTKVEIVKNEWVKSGDTITNLNPSQFMGLWKNDTGTYVQGADYNANGKVVAYYLVGSTTATDRPIMNILTSKDWLYGLLEDNYFTQTQAEYMKYTVHLYITGEELNNIDLSIFDPNEFVDTNPDSPIKYGDIGITAEDYEILCKITSAERGNGTQEQQEYVVCVILNRVLSSKFPDSVKSVVFAPGQFQPIRNGAYFSAVPSATTKAAVDNIIKNGDTTGGAVYFCTPAAAAKDSWWSTLEFLFNDNPGSASSHNFYTTAEIKNELGQYGDTSQIGGTIIEEAQKAHTYLETNGYSYAQVGLSIPNGILYGKTIDCSSYVSWVLYRAGFESEFSGHQKSSRVFMSNPWGWQTIASINDAKPGDILCYQGHVEIYAGSVVNNKPKVYNCGGSWSIKNPAPSTSSHTTRLIVKILRPPTH